MTSLLRYEQDGGVVMLTMNDPDTRNALTGNSMVAEFLTACENINADHSVCVAIVTGAGPAFSSGGDLEVMRNQFRGRRSGTDIQSDYRRGIQRLVLALYNLEVPTIAAVNGPAIGAGCDLACMCDMRIASQKAKFAESFIKLGLIPGDGGAWLLPRLIGPARAAEMAFTGAAIDAATALDYQLVSRVLPPDGLLPHARSLAQQVAANPSQALRLTKRLMRESDTARLDTTLEMAASFQALLHHSDAHEAGVMAMKATIAARAQPSRGA